MHTISNETAANLGLPLFSDSRPETTMGRRHWVTVYPATGTMLHTQAATRATALDWFAMAASATSVAAAELHGPDGLIGSVLGRNNERDELSRPDASKGALRARVLELETESSWAATRIAALERELSTLEGERDAARDALERLNAETGRALGELERTLDATRRDATRIADERDAALEALGDINAKACRALENCHDGEADTRRAWGEALAKIAAAADHAIEGSTPDAGDSLEAPRMEQWLSTGGL